MSGPLTGKKVAIIGNGPSGTDQAKEIDACDFVIRQTRWHTQGPRYSGFKVSAICGFNSRLEVPYRIHADRNWELWCPIPPFLIKTDPSPEFAADWRWLLSASDGRALRIVRNCINEELAAYVKHVSLFRKHPPGPDTGSVVIAMALDMGADHIHIWGYDRTGFGHPNDDWANDKYVDVKDQEHHDFRARYIIVSELVDNHTWCGRPIDLKEIEWHGRPPSPVLEPDPIVEPPKPELEPEPVPEVKETADADNKCD